jgi:prepilin-type N-terminal cleavage/methylation domain-containing protein
MHSRILRRRCDDQPTLRPQHAAPRKARRGFTLVEMLVAMALTLIMVYAIAEFYAYIGDSVRDGRAMIEMGGQLRAASQRLKRDLDSLTVRVVPWTDDGNNSGYFSYREGPASDSFPMGTTGDAITATLNFQNANSTNLISDGDDVLGFTITSGAEPFQGRFFDATQAVGSQETVTVSRQAEVVWWVGFRDVDNSGVYEASEYAISSPRFLFRRQLLIVPQLYPRPADSSKPAGWISGPHADLPAAKQALRTFHANNDISASIRDTDPSAGVSLHLIANSLTDLTRREHRFANQPSFPGEVDVDSNTTTIGLQYILGSASNAVGEDVVLSNLLGFDVKAFDPGAPIRTDSGGNVAVSPSDVGFGSAATADVAYGAYVDLNYNRNLTAPVPATTFSGAANSKSSLTSATYDTWALSYERDNGNAMNGIDNDNANGVDDPGERITSPPYPVPLRGIQVKIRMYDPSSRQVKQATVTADFIDE